jgi:hypothetical protein
VHAGRLLRSLLLASDHSRQLQLLRPRISRFFHVEPQSET